MDINQNQEIMLENLKKAADIHYKVRTECKQYIKTNQSYYDIVNLYQEHIQKYSDSNSGIAFPLGFSVNNICAHDSSYYGDIRKLNKNDILKIDIGIHYNGYIIDSAQTIIVDNYINNMNEYTKNLINSTIDATNTAIKNSGVDVRLYELSELIYETINSYDNIKPIGILGGHNIKQNVIHGGKLILCKPHAIQTDMKMEENEIYAIETFASTGTGNLINLDSITHYKQKRLDKMADKFMKLYDCKDFIKNRNGLPFNYDWIYRDINRDNNKDINNNNKNNNKLKIDKIKKELTTLTKTNIIEAYPPLSDTNKNALTSQLEHTIYVKESGIINLSKFDDY
jgi:methionyl aminopeptidase